MAITAKTVKNALETSNVAVIKGLQFLYSQQTADEQEAKDTAYKNHRGFKVCDAKSASDIVERINKGETLSMADMAQARHICMKYANTQLLDLARRVAGCD